jgi:hypothetical protein
MANNNIHFKNPNTGETRKAPVGYSWTVFFWNFIPPLFRSDWKGSGLIFIVTMVVFILLSDFAPNPAVAGVWVGIVFSFFYNKIYIKSLVKKGFQSYRVDHGDLTELVNKVDSSIPILEEPQTNPKPQEPEPKNEDSVEDKLRQLNELKEKNLINDEEYNKKKEKLLEEL